MFASCDPPLWLLVVDVGANLDYQLCTFLH